MNLLEDVNVVDLTARLPGPYAGYILASMGATVLKVENLNHTDAFSDKELHKLDPIFKCWYENLNAPKEKVILDFNKEMQVLKGILEKADIVLVPNKQKVIDLINIFEISQRHNLAVIKVGGHHEKNSAMHDLNALAQMKAFTMHTSEDPPFLPIAGISYGQQIATDAIALYLKVLKEKKSKFHNAFLDLSTQKLYSPFWSDNMELKEIHLHNGKFPCYNLYKTMDDSTIAVAAVEEKFWNIFIKSFELPLTLDDRYDTSGKIYKIIAKKIASLTTKQAKALLKEHDCCVTIVGQSC